MCTSQCLTKNLTGFLEQHCVTSSAGKLCYVPSQGHKFGAAVLEQELSMFVKNEETGSGSGLCSRNEYFEQET